MKTRRLSGEAYWRLQALLEKGEEKVKEYQRWAREECRKLQLIPDLVDLVAGVIYDSPVPQNKNDPSRRPLGLVEASDVIAEANRREAEIDGINTDLNKLIKRIAMKLNIRPDQINPKTGEIKADGEDVELTIVEGLDAVD